MKSTPIVIYGFGNLGSHIFRLLRESGFRNLLVATNHELQTSELVLENQGSQLLYANQCTRSDLEKIKSHLSDRGLIFICVNDGLINISFEFLKPLSENIQQVIMSGGFEFQGEMPKNVSVFYPLYSFNSALPVNWNAVPVFLESPNDFLFQLVQELPVENVYSLNSKQRNLLHVAAVFANNFTNAMMIAAQELLKSNSNLKFEFIQPILNQTFEKLQQHNAIDIQTGPAKRGDKVTIEKHLNILQSFSEERILYEAITKYISSKVK